MMYTREIPLNGETYPLAFTIVGSGVPTTATEALAGMLYMNTDTKAFYKCVSANGAYTWEPLV